VVPSGVLQRILGVRFKIDFGIDVGIVLLSAWLTSGKLVSFASRTAATLLLLPARFHHDRAEREAYWHPLIKQV